MSFVTRFNPKGGITDFWTEFKKPTPYRVPILLASIAPVALLMWWASEEQYMIAPEPPEVTYITTFAADQTDEEIMAKSAARQKIMDARRAELEAIAERKREIYRELGRATGVDVSDTEDPAEELEDAETTSDESAETPAESGQ